MTVGLSLGADRWRLIRRGDPIPQWFADTGADGLYVDGQAGEALFQDAARTQPAAIGDPVGGLLDLSGNGYHAGQATPSRRMLRTADGLFSDGTDDHLVVPAGVLTVGGAVTVSATARLPAGYTGNVRIVSSRSPSLVGYELYSEEGRMGAFAGTSNFVSPTSNAYINDGSWHVLTLRVDIPGNQVIIYVDGVVDRINPAPAAGVMNPSGRIVIGAAGDFAFGQVVWPDTIGGAVIAAAALSEPDRQLIEQRLAARVGITLP